MSASGSALRSGFSTAKQGFISGPCGACGRDHGLPLGGSAAKALDALLRRIRREGRLDLDAESPDPALSLATLQGPGDGKMIGVLVGTNARGDEVVLRAFSGRLGGGLRWAGWADEVVDVAAYAQEEEETLQALTVLRDTLAAGVFGGVDLEEARQALAVARAEAKVRRADLMRDAEAARETRESRRWESREVPGVLAGLERESQAASGRERAARAAIRATLESFEESVERGEAERVRLRQEQNRLSRALTERIQAAYRLMNWRGEIRSIPEIFQGDGGVPTGTGDCCAPKLLQQAVRLGVRPTSLAECWLGGPPAGGGREEGGLQPPCKEKCVPILGFLLCGLEERT